MAIADRIYVKDRPIFERLKCLSLADLYRVPVTTLPLNKRALDTLQAKLRTRTLGELVVLTTRDLMKQQNFGVKSLRQLEVYLAELGLGLNTRPAEVQQALAVPSARPPLTQPVLFETPPEKTAREIELEGLLADATSMLAKMTQALKVQR